VLIVVPSRRVAGQIADAALASTAPARLAR
jgi:hypothetical protein